MAHRSAQDRGPRFFSVEDALSYYVGLKAGGVPVELHSYAEGGHGFGLRRTNLAATEWPRLVETWLAAIGMIPRIRAF